MRRPDPRRRTAVSSAAVLGLLIAVATAVGGCGAARAPSSPPVTVTLQAAGSSTTVVSSGPPATTTGTATAPTGTVTTAATPTPAGGHPLLHLQAAITRYAKPLGSHVGILVQDLKTGQVLYSQNPAVQRAPASVEKLYTSAALLWTFDPGAVLHTSILGDGHLATGGVWDGNLFLRGDGDPTFGDVTWRRLAEHGLGASAGSLILQLKRAGIRKVTGHLYADASLFDADEGGPLTDNQPDIPDYGGEMSALVYDHGYTVDGLSPAVTAAHMIAVAAKREGVVMHTAPRPGITPTDAMTLATVASPTMAQMLELMDVPSDDLFADMFAKQLGVRDGGTGTLTSGAEAIARAIATHYSLHPTILDGSGLDKSDRSSPAEIVSLLSQLHGTSIGDVVEAALPVVGETGTVRTIGLGTPAVGRCVAKTGTLNYVTNLAGYCHARDGHTLAFAILVDGPGNYTALVPMGKIAGEIAFY